MNISQGIFLTIPSFAKEKAAYSDKPISQFQEYSCGPVKGQINGKLFLADVKRVSDDGEYHTATPKK